MLPSSSPVVSMTRSRREGSQPRRRASSEEGSNDPPSAASRFFVRAALAMLIPLSGLPAAATGQQQAAPAVTCEQVHRWLAAGVPAAKVADTVGRLGGLVGETVSACVARAPRSEPSATTPGASAPAPEPESRSNLRCDQVLEWRDSGVPNEKIRLTVDRLGGLRDRSLEDCLQTLVARSAARVVPSGPTASQCRQIQDVYESRVPRSYLDSLARSLWALQPADVDACLASSQPDSPAPAVAANRQQTKAAPPAAPPEPPVLKPIDVASIREVLRTYGERRPGASIGDLALCCPSSSDQACRDPDALAKTTRSLGGREGCPDKPTVVADPRVHGLAYAVCLEEGYEGWDELRTIPMVRVGSDWKMVIQPGQPASGSTWTWLAATDVQEVDWRRSGIWKQENAALLACLSPVVGTAPTRLGELYAEGNPERYEAFLEVEPETRCARPAKYPGPGALTQSSKIGALCTEHGMSMRTSSSSTSRVAPRPAASAPRSSTSQPRTAPAASSPSSSPSQPRTAPAAKPKPKPKPKPKLSPHELKVAVAAAGREAYAYKAVNAANPYMEWEALDGFECSYKVANQTSEILIAVRCRNPSTGAFACVAGEGCIKQGSSATCLGPATVQGSEGMCENLVDMIAHKVVR